MDWHAVASSWAIDLDGFGPINKDPRYGQAVGDEVIAEIGRRLRGQARTGDAVARPGGDEFGGFFAGSFDPESAVRLGERLLTEIRRPVVTSKGILEVGASIGLVIVVPGPDLPDNVFPMRDGRPDDAGGQARRRRRAPARRRLLRPGLSGLGKELADHVRDVLRGETPAWRRRSTARGPGSGRVEREPPPNAHSSFRRRGDGCRGDRGRRAEVDVHHVRLRRIRDDADAVDPVSAAAIARAWSRYSVIWAGAGEGPPARTRQTATA